MKILHINTNDSVGGAAIAAMRLHKIMLASGIDSTFFCLNRTINDDERILTVNRMTRIKSRTVDSVFQRMFNRVALSKIKGLFSNMRLGYNLRKFVDLNEYDVIYLHWINNSFLSLTGLEEICKSGKKVLWFMHDMFPITGGCHHSFLCQNYKRDCYGHCPYMKNSKKSKHFAFKQLRTKRKILNKYSNISFIAPSKWLYDCTINSSLIKNHSVYNIPNLLDQNVFRPLEKSFCKKIYNFPENKRIILFGADSALINPYKGFNYLVEALNILNSDDTVNTKDLLLVVFGSSYNKTIEGMLPIETRFLGTLHDEISLSLLYNSVSVFCIPSIAENFPNTILESINCHTPVVGFNVGGIPDLINSNRGYLAKYKDSEDFAKGIAFVLANEGKFSFSGLEELQTELILEKHKKIISNS